MEPPGNYNDQMAPPEEDIEVECLHCGQRYCAHEMRYERRPEYSRDVLWWCKNPLCNGAGFDWDIFDVRQLEL